MIGKTISHYKITAELGRGGMGVVYEAEHTRLKQPVALKFLPRELTGNASAKTRFVHEAQAASSLKHNNVCTIHDIDETTDGRLFICMDLYKGGSLKERMGSGPMNVGDAIDLATQVADGLSAAHDAGIVHRDIKPANILLTSAGQAKIADFGLAKLTGRTRVTKTGTTLGTAPYMSPEQTQGRDVDHRSDIWSLGVMLYQMLTGELPFLGDHDVAVAYGIVNVDPVPLSVHRADVPGGVQAIINKCLAKNPTERYQSAAEVRDELKALRHDMPGAGRISAGSRAPLPTPKIRNLTLGIASIILGVVVVFIAFKILIPGTSDAPADKSRLVVLPFVNLGPPEEEYFVDGLTDAITARLASVHALEVISRQTAIQYKGSNKSIREIGDKLDVDYVLEGTVQRERPGDPESPIRVIPQFISVEDDAHVWATTYDEGATELFRIQSEIAERVASALDLTVNDTERGLLAAKPTESLEAYEYYLKSKSLAAKSYYGSDRIKAVPSMERAVAIDPGFVEAWAELAIYYSELVYQAFGTAEYQAKAKAAIDRAFELDPDLPEVQFAMGRYYYESLLDYEKSYKFFEHYVQKRPSAAAGYAMMACVDRRRGQWELAATQFEHAVKLDPLGWDGWYSLGEHYAWMRWYNDAAQCLERAVEQTPDAGARYMRLAEVYLSIDRNKDRAVRTIREAYRKADIESIASAAFLPLHRIVTFEDDYISDAVMSAPIAPVQYRHVILAYLYEHRGESQAALVHFDSLRIALEDKIAAEKGLTRLSDLQYGRLGVAYAALGQKNEAIQAGRYAVERFPLSQDALFGFLTLSHLAEIYVRVGEYEAAIDQLEILLSVPSNVTAGILSLDPLWDPLRDSPRFQKLLKTAP